MQQQKEREKTSIILVNGSPFLHDVIHKAIDKQKNLEIAADIDQIEGYPAVVEQTDADWTYLLLPPGADIPKVVEEVLLEKEAMRLLVMATDGSKVRVKWAEDYDRDLEVDDLKQIFSVLENQNLIVENNL